MSGLHGAVAHAVADALDERDAVYSRPAAWEAAAAAVGVCLAEAQRAINSVPHSRAWVQDAEGEARNRGLDEALAALAALAEEQRAG